MRRSLISAQVAAADRKARMIAVAEVRAMLTVGGRRAASVSIGSPTGSSNLVAFANFRYTKIVSIRCCFGVPPASLAIHPRNAVSSTAAGERAQSRRSARASVRCRSGHGSRRSVRSGCLRADGTGDRWLTVWGRGAGRTCGRFSEVRSGHRARRIDETIGIAGCSRGPCTG